MSMSRVIYGFAPPDEKWQQMKAIYDACRAAKIPIPADVDRFFDGVRPDPAGVQIDLTRNNCEAVREWNSEYGMGYEVDLDKLPPHIKMIRFFTC
jgi:hypothetical protein